ncbi:MULTISPECIES: restriction endonuclease [Bacillus]|uniref:5-methylcytosine-specific restriction enzyme MRR n=1 Tax=Bacillus wiedmannii TaxID=1890302 RepID=A0AB37YU05_9BACI|nr:MULTISPECIES: restriction endonuclease [Bacillus]OOR22726.1 restriction endonuclease [Bacillus wiedmannii]PEJ40044.1 restriction endonuclease [Bacillus wiedmannii]PEO19817.1 restriction endonuclease [Bacillus wiedmannii]UNK31258.1 restriction endonuclease [Bacillus sp. N5-665]SCC45904.1 5-methylcytosine-specific restriction enzyme MRR [Bacillus wiedmannii]
MLYAFLIVAGILYISWYVYKRRKDHHLYQLIARFNKDEEFKRTLAMGLYYRFMKPLENEKCSSVFIRQTPLEFEAFVADVFEKYYGGSAFVTVATGDYGVDFEHTVNGELYLGQVKCLCNDMSYKAIALVHSNIAKREAKGGYVVSTGGFSKNAKKYAEELNVQLIDGSRLAEMYMESIEGQPLPQYALNPASN